MSAAMDRREMFGAAAAAASLACAATRNERIAQPRPQDAAPRAREAYPVMVGSANALAGMRSFYAQLTGGSDPLDAAIEVVKVVEKDPSDSSVGLGGLPNEEGVVQLDAAVMHGPTHNSGAVACLENIVHPSEVARLVMERTDHCLIVGEGAYRFARAHGFERAELLTPESRREWLRWKESLSPEDDWLAPPDGTDEAGRKKKTSWELKNRRLEHTLARVRALEALGYDHAWGTIHCSALSVRGEVACVTTTSGLAFKIPGRVGDSPIIGAGLYCDQEAGSAGSTGRGEASILSNGSFAIVEQLRRGSAPLDAGMEVLRRIARQVQRQAKWQPALLAADGKPAFNVNFYVLALDGRTAGVTLKGGGRYSVADPERGPRHEELVPLFA